MSEDTLLLSSTTLQNADRLEALYQCDILDTPPEKAFDDLTRLAAQICETPLSFITFVDRDHQFFKSVFGANATTAPLKDGFCPYLVEQEEILIVNDAPNDPKFNKHPAIANLGLKFYAGVPLKTEAGQTLGTLCVVDTEPRQLSHSQILSLKALGQQVMSQLELRTSTQTLAQTNAALTAISQCIATTVGKRFFSSVVKQFTQALDVDYAYISLLEAPHCDRLKTIAVCHQGQIVDNFEYSLQDTPCSEVLRTRSLHQFSHQLTQRFSKVPMLKSLSIESYAAIPICGTSSEPLGVLAIMDTKPIHLSHLVESLLTIFSVRIATELERRQSESHQTALLAQTKTALQHAEQANRSKDEFLAVVSHELRSPLNPIVGWAQLLRRGRLTPEKTTEALSIIERSAYQQVRLIDDLLDISRILRGKMSLQVAPVRLIAPISAALETVQLAAAAKSIAIKSTFSAEPVVVMGDENRLQQIAWNLLSNAVKFTPEKGTVQIALSATQGFGKIEVSDTGKGIDASFLPYVFERFQQEDYSTTRKFGGLGLGLSIVRHLVENHGGTIEVQSKGEGKGTTFTVSIPLASETIPPVEAPTQVSVSDLSHINVLVVDDNPDSRLITEITLAQTGATVTCVDSGEAALKRFGQKPLPDLLVSDIGMPHLDGYGLIAQIRQLAPEQGGNVLAIALTAYADKSDAQKALRAGFQRHLAKPVEPDTLIETAISLIQERTNSD